LISYISNINLELNRKILNNETASTNKHVEILEQGA